MRQVIVATCGLLISLSSIAAGPNFDAETSQITKTIGCHNPKVQPGYGLPKAPLYICHLGENEYRKVFVNDDGGGRVRNIKIMWDDRTKSMPPLPPVHAEKAEARAMLDAVLTRYAPDHRDRVKQVFLNAKQSAQFESAAYRMEFLYSNGPSMDERLLVLTPK